MSGAAIAPDDTRASAVTPWHFYALLGVGLFSLALYTFIVQPHLLRKILAFNIMGSSVFLVLAGLAGSSTAPDPVPHAMVITGIVVAVSATALALVLMLRLRDASDRITLHDDQGG